MAYNNSILAMLEQFSADMTKQAAEETGKTIPVSEGSRASENSSDVKSTVPGTSVDSTGPINSVPGAGAKTPTNTMAGAAATGEDKVPVKSSPTDPGTSHPAKAGGEKYASASIDDIINGGNQLLAEITVFSKSAATKVAKKAVIPPNPNPAHEAQETPAEEKKEHATGEEVSVKKADYERMSHAAAQWEEFLGYLAGQDAVSGLNKTASTQPDADLIKLAQAESTRLFNEADNQSTALIDFILGMNSVKSANDMGAETDPAILAALAGGGGDPAAAAGGELPVEGVPAGGEEIDPATLEALVQALAEQGVNPGDLAAADSATEGGEGGEGGGERDAVDDAQAAAAGEVGSDDETEGAKKEAQWTVADVQKAANIYAKFVKAASARAQTQKVSNKRK